MRDSQLFDSAVKRVFEPIAHKNKLPIVKIRDGIYDIQSPQYIVRIRLHTSHQRGFNISLRPGNIADFDENDAGIEQYGIGWFAKIDGDDLDEILIDVRSDEDLLKQADLLANAFKIYFLPYLMGFGDERTLDYIRDLMRKKNETDIKEIKSYRFPPSVQKRWHLPKLETLPDNTSTDDNRRPSDDY